MGGESQEMRKQGVCTLCIFRVTEGVGVGSHAAKQEEHLKFSCCAKGKIYGLYWELDMADVSLRLIVLRTRW